MSNSKPRYGQIVIHESAAGNLYGRFLEVCEDDKRKFLCRVVDPQTMRVVRWTEEDVKNRRCQSHAVGHPVMGWGWLDRVKFAGSVGGAKDFHAQTA